MNHCNSGLGIYTGMCVYNNTISGLLPTWPNRTGTNMFVLPGSNLCGAVSERPCVRPLCAP